MAYLKYGITYVKDNGSYKPLKGLWTKQNGTWTPVKTAWYKRSDGVWERIYPTPRGINTPTVSTLTFNPYRHYQDVPAQTFTISNTGDYDLVINSVFVNDSVGNYITCNFPTPLPTTIPQAGRLDFPINVYGNTVGTFTGNIAFTNYTGYLGYANTSIPVTVNVRPDYNGITVTPNLINLTYYVSDTATTTTISINNSGNGGDLLVSSIASQNGYVTASGISTPAVIGGVFSNSGNFATKFTGNTQTFTLTATTSLGVGKYQDNLTFTSNATNAPTLTIPVNLTVLKPHGIEAFTNPGTYSFTVPAHVHSINLFAIGAGGGGGAALPNGVNGTNQGGSGGGGGSGAYLTQSYTVTPGDVLSVTVGDGGVGGVNQNAQYFPVSLSYSWGTFMNTYAVWTNADGITPISRPVTSNRLFNAPYSGNYTFSYAADNTLAILVDGTQVATTSDFTSSSSTVVYMAQGNRRLSFVAENIGGPAGFAVTIVNTNNTLLWSTRTDLSNYTGGGGGATSVTGNLNGTMQTIVVYGGNPGNGAYDDYVPPTPSDSGGDGIGGGGDAGV